MTENNEKQATKDKKKQPTSTTILGNVSISEFRQNGFTNYSVSKSYIPPGETEPKYLNLGLDRAELFLLGDLIETVLKSH